MKPALPGAGLLSRSISGLVLWAYLLLLCFVWFIARYTSEGAVLVRLGAGILCDLVWIPLGLGLWFSLLHWILRLILKPQRWFESLLALVLAILGALVLVLIFMQVSFVLLPIALALFLVRFVARRVRPGLPFTLVQNLLPVYLPFVLVVLLTGYHYRMQLVPPLTKVPVESSIRVMTYNLKYDAGAEGRRQAMDAIRREAPDVVCLQEFHAGIDPDRFRAEFEADYPYVVSTSERAGGSGDIVLVMSRLPVRAFSREGLGAVGGGSQRILFTVLEVFDRQVCLACVHLHSGGHGVEEAARKRLSPEELAGLIGPRERSIEVTRQRQAAYLAETAAACGLPVILAGDLNDTPNSRVYQTLDAVFDNAFALHGWGLGATFGESWILGKRRLQEIPFLGLFARDLLRIDHIFVSPDLEVVSARVVRDARGSDHKPVMAEIGVAESGVPESGVPESGVPESGVPESGVPESGAPEIGLLENPRGE